jgi:tetratricopeptide (TPR) repeat protein
LKIPVADAAVPSACLKLRCAPCLIALAAWIGGCALTPSTAATADDQTRKPEVVPQTVATAPASPTEQTQYHILAGELAAGRQQPHEAAQEFLLALDTAPDKDLAARATRLAVESGDPELALMTARRWLALDSTSLEAREVIVRTALHQSLDEEAYTQCDRIVRDHPGGEADGFHHVALLLSGDPGKSANALALMSRLVAAFPKLPGAYRAQSLLAQRYGENQMAEDAAREALKLEPQSKESTLLLIGALVKQGKIDEADGLMDSVTHGSADASEIRLKYAQLLLESNQNARGREQLERVLKAEPENVDAHFLLGLLDLDEHQLDEAQAQFEILAKKHGHLSDAEYYLGRVAEIRRDWATALAHYEKVGDGPQGLDALMRRAAMLGKVGRIDEAQTLLDEMREQLPQMGLRFQLAEGEILLDAGANDKALAVYNDALASTPDSADLLYARSLVYEHTGKVDLAEADLRAIIAKQPDDARSLNALGYMLTVHGQKYDEAQKLIDRALQLTPDEPAVIDSAGWLRYRQGHAKDALPLLQKAYAMFPDGEIAAHLGEVMWSLGNKDEARALLARASHDDPENPVLRDAVKRIEQ